MRCAIIAICMGFLCLQYIDCVNSYSTCQDYNCVDYGTSSNYAVLKTFLNYTCVTNCWQDYLYNTSWYILYDTCENSCRQDFINSTNTSRYTLYYTCEESCWQDYYALYSTCVDTCKTSCCCSLKNTTMPPTGNQNENLEIPGMTDYGFVAFNVVMLLAVVLPVIVVNTALLVALILESSIAKVLRLVLASILISCLLTALGLAMFHIAEIVLNVSPVITPPVQPCTITVFLIFFGGAARLVFMATFAIAVYIVVKRGESTKKHIVVAVLVAVAVLWVITFLGAFPLFSQEVFVTQYWKLRGSYYCYPDGIQANEHYFHTFVWLSLLFFSVVTPSVAVIFLLIVCCNKHSNISYTAVERAMVKFGFFLLLGNGLNMIGLVVPLLIVIVTGIHPRDLDGIINLVYTAYTIVNIGLMPTPILILIFFKSIRKRLLYWLCCCCMSKKRKAKRNRKNNNNVEGRMVTTEV